MDDGFRSYPVLDPTSPSKLPRSIHLPVRPGIPVFHSFPTTSIRNSTDLLTLMKRTSLAGRPLPPKPNYKTPVVPTRARSLRLLTEPCGLASIGLFGLTCGPGRCGLKGHLGPTVGRADASCGPREKQNAKQVPRNGRVKMQTSLRPRRGLPDEHVPVPAPSMGAAVAANNAGFGLGRRGDGGEGVEAEEIVERFLECELDERAEEVED